MPPATDPRGAHRPGVLDVVGVTMLTGMLGLPYLLLGANDTNLVTLVTVVMMTVALYWRRSNPTLMLTLVTIGGIVQLVALRYPATSVVVVPLAAYNFARHTDGRRARLVLPLGAAASLLGPFSWMASLYQPYEGYSTSAGDIVTVAIMYTITVMVCAGLVVTPYAIGRRLRDAEDMRLQRAQAERDRYEAALLDRENQARMAEARARAQIARELHDIVAHSLSVMIVQAEGGKALAAKRPERAAEVLGTIAETGRDALLEMRRIVGVLRGGPEETPDYAPAPGLLDIPEMVQRSGERVRFEVHGATPRVPQTLGLTIYRVAQEAVTNVLKHGGPEANAVVSLYYTPKTILLEVIDDGRGADASSDGMGHGLRGMHERVAAMGGVLVARPRSSGGFLVRATLPMPGHSLTADPLNPNSLVVRRLDHIPSRHTGFVPSAEPITSPTERRIS